MSYASILRTEGDFTQSEVCRLTVRGGIVIPSTDHPDGQYVLSPEIMVRPDNRKLTALDGLDFLRALPFVFSGSRLRVAFLESDSVDEKYDPLQARVPIGHGGDTTKPTS